MSAVPAEHPLTVTPLQPGDLDGIRRLAPLLSSRSLYQRYFVGTPTLPRRALDRLATLDHDRHDAVVGRYDGRVIGWAEYGAWPGEPTAADIAVLVADPWQGLGIGPQLVRALAEIARSRGYTTATASVLPANVNARHALERLWPHAVPVLKDGTLVWRLPLGPAPITPRSAPIGLRVP